MKVDYLVVSFARSDDIKLFEKTFEEAVETLKKQAPAVENTKKEESKKSD